MGETDFFVKSFLFLEWGANLFIAIFSSYTRTKLPIIKLILDLVVIIFSMLTENLNFYSSIVD